MLTKLYLAFLAVVALAVPAPVDLDLELDTRDADIDLGVRSSRPIPMYIHPKKAPHMCLTAFRQGQGQYYGARLYVHKCQGTKNQQFRVAYGTTVLWFQDLSAQGNTDEHCVVTGFTAWDDPTVNMENGRPAQLFLCPPQKDAVPTGDTSKPVNGVWVQHDRGTIKVKNTNICLDLRDGNANEGGQVQQWQCFNGNKNQQWIVDTKGIA